MSEQRRNNRPFVIALGVIAIVGVLALAWSATRPKAGLADVDLKADPSQARGYLLGDSTAPLQIYEFADFECPACGNFATLTEPDVRKALVQTGKASFRYFDYPLPMHRNTWQASNAAACADEQGKFWEMHDMLFANQDRWNGEATSNPKPALKGYAQSLGLDVAKWEQCYDANRYRSRIASNRAEAERRRIGSTPTFIIGNKMVSNSISFDEFMKYASDAQKSLGTSGGTGAAVTGTSPPNASAPGSGTAKTTTPASGPRQ